MKLDVVICGVGGQGVLLASEILALTALEAGLDVKKSEIHGMAQRGGSVFSFVRIGEKVFSPVIPLSSADFMLAFEELEALRYAPFLKEKAKVLINRQRINPITVLSGEASYPEDVIPRLRRFFEVFEIKATEIAEKEIKNVRTTNMVMLGFLSGFIEDFTEDLWLKVIKENLPAKLIEPNLKAFLAGRRLSHESRVQAQLCK